MALTGKLTPVEEIDAHTREKMLGIMKTYYANVSDEQFQSDLSEKDAVILICEQNENGAHVPQQDDFILRGFSTQKLFDHEVDGAKIKILFSGDTIIEQQYWNSMALPIAWGRMMLDYHGAYPDTTIYWLLTTKGYKTYRFLPVFFEEFYPRYDFDTPEFETKLLHSLGERFFPERHIPQTLVLRGGESAQKLASHIGHVTDNRLKDPHIAFFLENNPDYAKGDELMAIARCSPDNIKKFIAKRLEK